ncbi:MAG: TetR/AcrR family transcriptional regulator [Pseudomonadota bacterium]
MPQGLRARGKAQRSGKMLQAASQLIREQGYDQTRIEDIAARAEVSVGTFYNYFSTKGDLLLAIVSMEVEEVLAQGSAIVASPPGDVAQTLNALVGGYFDHSLVYLSKEMWRRAMAISIEAPDTPFSRRYTALDGLLCQQVCDAIAALQRRGRARIGISATDVGALIFNNLNMMFIEFVKSDPMTLDQLSETVARQNRPLVALLTP